MFYAFFLLFCEAAENFQISFREPATTEMDGIYLFNCHLLFIIICIILLVWWLLFLADSNFLNKPNIIVFNFSHATSNIHCFFSTCRLLLLKYGARIFILFFNSFAKNCLLDCWLFIRVATSSICRFFSICQLSLLKYKVQTFFFPLIGFIFFIFFTLNTLVVQSGIGLLLIHFFYLITNAKNMLYCHYYCCYYYCIKSLVVVTKLINLLASKHKGLMVKNLPNIFNNGILISRNKLIFGSFFRPKKSHYFFKTQQRFFCSEFNNEYPLKLYFGKPLENKELIKQRLFDHLNLTGEISEIQYEHIMGKLIVFITAEEFDLFPKDEKFSASRTLIEKTILRQQYEVSIDPNKKYSDSEIRSFGGTKTMEFRCISKMHGVSTLTNLKAKYASENFDKETYVNVKPGSYKTESSKREIIKHIIKCRGTLTYIVFCQIVNKVLYSITEADLLLIPDEFPEIRAKIRKLVKHSHFEASIYIRSFYSQDELQTLEVRELRSVARAHGIKNCLGPNGKVNVSLMLEKLNPIMNEIKEVLEDYDNSKY